MNASADQVEEATRLLDQLADELLAEGKAEFVDFFMPHRQTSSSPPLLSEIFGMRYDEEAGGFRVWYRDMGVLRVLLEAAPWEEARDLYVEKVQMQSDYLRGRPPRVMPGMEEPRVGPSDARTAMREPGTYVVVDGEERQASLTAQTAQTAQGVWIKGEARPIPLREVDAAFRTSTFATWRGARIVVSGIWGDRVGFYTTDQAFAESLGLPGDFYNGWRGDAPISELADVEEKVVPLELPLDIDAADREAADGKPNIAKLADQLLPALGKLPEYRGISFRGATLAEAFTNFRGTLVTQGLTPTSRDSRIATENFATEAVFAIVGAHGRNLTAVSRRPHEHEVVFLPGTLFHEVHRARFERLAVVVVEELDRDRDPRTPKGDLQELLRLVASHLRRDRARDPVRISSPGKFVGDIA